MEDIKDSVSITYAKNLSKQNFSTIINMPIDTNVNIKTILNVGSYTYDEKIDCASGKAVLSGKIGVKVLYIDTDNITNSVTDSQPFSQTITDNSITADCYINLSNKSIINTVLSTDGNLKINCDINMSPVMYLNLGINANNNFDNMITKKSTINTSCISNKVKTNFEYTTTFETKDNVSKILCYNSYFSPSSTTSNDGYAIVEGKLYSCLVYETSENEEIKIKQITDTFNVKTDVEIENLNSACALDLSIAVDKSYENTTMDLDDGNSVITIINKIDVCGVAFKDVSIDVVEDLYSTDNEIELSYANREFVAKTNYKMFVENVLSETSLSKDEPAIDEIISNLNANPEITNTYIKDGFVYVEGVITSSLVYIDENKEFCQKQIEIPFVVNTKIEEEKLFSNHSNVSVLNCKVKVKRGTIIEIEYDLCFDLCEYVTDVKDIVDNLTLGKNLDFSNYDYQIYIAKPNETLWQLSKRIKVYPDELNKLNHNLPSIFTGGEKVIIKR